MFYESFFNRIPAFMIQIFYLLPVVAGVPAAINVEAFCLCEAHGSHHG